MMVDVAAGPTTVSEHPDDIAVLRQFFSRLTETLSSSNDPRQFLISLIYKGIVEDILRNCMEDDYIRQQFVHDVVTQLEHSYRSTYDLSSEQSRNHWFDQLLEFSAKYRQLPSYRRSGDCVTVNGLKFFVASESDPLLGPPIADQNRHLSLRMFPNLDDTVTDPSTARQVIRWYVDTIRRERDDLKAHGADIGALCFIEKPFSAVGALALLAHIVDKVGIASSIYRSGYWETNARLRGTMPAIGSNAILIYDVAIHGTVLEEAARFLRDKFSIRAVSAVVMYDFGLGASANLARSDIRLISYVERSAVDRQLTAKYTLVSSLRQSQDKLIQRIREEGRLTASEVEREADEGLDRAFDRYRAVMAQRD
ncbi:MAG: hypothetical protein ACR2PL_25720 [Dehalococcoidia bacterium]